MHRKLTLAAAFLLATQSTIAGTTSAAISTAQPNVHVMPAIEMGSLQRERSYRVYLPESYQDSNKRYPVLYMHDGQNLFDDATSYVGEWGVDETLNRLAQTCGLEIIVVGIDHGDKLRMTELNPYDNERFGKGEGDAYVDFLVNTLKPRIDQEYRTLSERAHTAVMGSSMGGLISNHAINRYPKIFGAVGIFSPSYWIAPEMFAATASNSALKDTRIYLSTGKNEGESMIDGFTQMQAVLKQHAHSEQWQAQLDADGEHNEAFWKRIFPRAVSWLFSKESEGDQCAAETTSQAREFVPQWAKGAVWYQIFPERFRNGDTSNDPKVEDIAGADPQELPNHWNVHPWGSDWYQLQPYEQANGEPELWKHLLRRRYGGDLQGVIDKLDYIKGLGINAIYLNPVFDAPSLHKYDGASYHHIDPNFGPDPEGDRKLMATENPLDPSSWVWTKADELALELISEAHRRGIRVIFDGVFNHMGVKSFAFQDLRTRQQESPYKDWFIVESFRDESSATEFRYSGWFGVESLPEFKEDEYGLVSGPRDYVFAATQRWMNPKGRGIEHGIDGWRLDVAYDVHHNFWKSWRSHVKSINPEAYLTAEIVDKPEKVKPYLQGDEFDGEMNYNFAFTAAEFFFNPPETNISASEFDQKLRELRKLYPSGVAYVVQNLFGSHDSNRVGSHIVNRGIGNFRDWGNYFTTSQAINNPEYAVRKPNEHEVQLQKLFAIFQMTYVGAPMIYYGDEVGMWGANDPDSRKPMIWPDIEYADEVFLPGGGKRSADKVVVNGDLLSHYRALIKIRRQNPALQLGSFETTLIDDERQLYSFKREYRDNQVLVLLNNSSTDKSVSADVLGASVWRGALNNESEAIDRHSGVVKISAHSGTILVKH